ncbi:MAG TPA: outer membrane protein assembly factor BamD [Acidobacteriaceae bacterium]|jgi:outer membrane protein assembly factor BamD|nr:outer membrane protein assembly factor BamD [Acidobacteriaceae bacterium]
MNRLVLRVSAVCLGAAIAFSPCAFAKKKQKHKKNEDLSANPLGNVQSNQPDKLLFDKAMKAMKKGHFDVARLDLQTLLNTYPESEYDMRAKLAVGDTWFKEGGTAALSQAESEYKDFITFFPQAPEAAEAQMKVGDIYFQQMEKPDRDPQNAVHAEEEYRTMLEQFPDSPLIPRAKQKLREVQEVLAQRQFEVGEYYASRENYAAAIARLQTVTDSYPLFSKSDQTLITIGDAYAVEAQKMGQVKLPAKAKAELVRYYDDQAVSAWDRVVTRYPLAPHVEDAKDRLIAMGRPIPEASAQALAESQAEEDSRVNVKLGTRTLALLGHGPNTVKAARVGEPSLQSPAPVTAPAVLKESSAAFRAAVTGKPIPAPGSMQQPAGEESATGTGNNTVQQAQPGEGAAPGEKLTFEEVPDASGSPGSTVTVPSGGEGGATSATEVPGNGAAGNGAANGAAPSGGANAQPIVAPVGPTDQKPMPGIDKPAEAPQQINEVPAGQQNAQVKTGATASGKPNKKKKAPFDKKDESSSQHKKKKGLDKINPF